MLCECGCGEEANVGRRFILGHNHQKGRIVSKETREKIRQSMKGKQNTKGFKPSEESKKKMSESHKGKIVSKETRKKISKSSRGRIVSAETRKKISETLKQHKGWAHSEKTKKKISEALKGKQNAKGCIRSVETKKKISAKNKGRLPSPKCSYGKRSHYESPLQGTVCFRSSYELAYAKYLDSTGEMWMYEAFTFSITCGTYTPDFFLPRQEKFVEIKGYMFPEARQKVEQFQKEYVEELEILYQEGLAELGVFV